MARSMMAPPSADSMNDSGRLEAEGWFHFIVKDCKDGERPYTGKAAEGFAVKLQVAEGEHEGKEIELFLQDGSPSHKDEGAFCNKRQCAFLIAANVITVAALQSAFSYELEHCRGQQFIGRLKFGKPNDNGEKYLDFDGLKLHHVDDPRVADVAKNVDALAIIPKELRRPAEYFAPLIGTSGGGKKGGGGSAPPAAPAFDPSGL